MIAVRLLESREKHSTIIIIKMYCSRKGKPSSRHFSAKPKSWRQQTWPLSSCMPRFRSWKLKWMPRRISTSKMCLLDKLCLRAKVYVCKCVCVCLNVYVCVCARAHVFVCASLCVCEKENWGGVGSCWSMKAGFGQNSLIHCVTFWVLLENNFATYSACSCTLYSTSISGGRVGVGGC